MLGWDIRLRVDSEESNTYKYLSIAEAPLSSTSLDKNKIILIDKSKTRKVRKWWQDDFGITIEFASEIKMIQKIIQIQIQFSFWFLWSQERTPG